MLDSFGRYESDSLDGGLFLADSYDECTGSQLLASGTHDRPECARRLASVW
jgi:hypothetical protein